MKTKRHPAFFLIFLMAVGLTGICGQAPRAYGADAVPVMVRDINPGTGNGIDPAAMFGSPFAALNGRLYFGGHYGSGVTDYALFQSNGIESGTIPIQDKVLPVDLIRIGNVVYYWAESDSGMGLWKCDGTAGNMIKLGDFSTAWNLTQFRNELFFAGTDSAGLHGYELWKSDGTVSGTTVVKDIISGVTGGLLFLPPLTNLAVLNDQLFFAASDSSSANLWRSDGTASGTTSVFGNPTLPIFLSSANGLLYYSDLFSMSLAGSDGTASGTTILHPNIGMFFTPAGGKVFFSGNSAETGTELWATDGTPSGTTLLKDIASGVTSSFPYSLIAVRDTLYFSADDGMNGRQLWKSDGTSEGTVMVKQINPFGHGLEPSLFPYFINMNGTLYFRADDGVHGVELWKSDGTESGTTLVMDICSGVAGSRPVYLTDVAGSLYFAAYDDEHGYELWKMNVYTTGNANSGSSGGGGGGGGGCFVGTANRVSGLWFMVSGLWFLVLGLGAAGMASKGARGRGVRGSRVKRKSDKS